MFKRCLWSTRSARPWYFRGMPLKLKETNTPTKNEKFENSIWQETDQLAIYKHDRDAELESTEKLLQLNGQSET